MADTVIAELQDDLRRQQLHDAVRRYGPYGVLLALLLVFGTAGTVLWRNHQASQQEQVTGALYEGLGADAQTKPAESAATLNGFADSHAGDPQADLARLLAAGLQRRATDVPGALKDLQTVMENGRADASLRGAATIMWAQTAVDTLPPADVQTKLAPYQVTDSPFRFAAWELGALAAHKAGDHAKAQGFIDQLLADHDTPDTVQQRAALLQRVL